MTHPEVPSGRHITNGQFAFDPIAISFRRGPMKKLMILVAAGAFLAAAPAFAADNAQQNKMTACNASAGDKKGDERKAYMSNCLSAKPVAAPAKPESKMAMCNKKTAGLDKDARAKAQSECMKAPA
jgi:hypothetical protein